MQDLIGFFQMYLNLKFVHKLRYIDFQFFQFDIHLNLLMKFYLLYHLYLDHHLKMKMLFDHLIEMGFVQEFYLEAFLEVEHLLHLHQIH